MQKLSYILYGDEKMKVYKLLNKSKILVVWGLTLLTIAVLLIFPSQCRNGGTNGIFLCVQVLIPSLFPFMVLSSFIVESGLCEAMPLWIGKLTKLLFRLPESTTCVILLSVVGGYPVGASGIKSLWKANLITDKQAQRMSLFCVASGPGFLVTYIGAVMTRSLRTGYILLISQILSVIILGILSRFTDKESLIDKNFINKTNIKITDAIVPSVTNAIKACSLMCALVVLFAVVCEVMLSFTQRNTPLRWTLALLEITNGTKILAEGSPTMLISFACGFGGLCVHLQIFSQLQGIGISKSLFYIFRILQGLICSTITFFLLKIFPVAQAVFSTIDNAEGRIGNTATSCIMLILCCCAFLISIKNIKTNKT